MYDIRYNYPPLSLFNHPPFPLISPPLKKKKMLTSRLPMFYWPIPCVLSPKEILNEIHGKVKKKKKKKILNSVHTYMHLICDIFDQVVIIMKIIKF